MDILVSLFLMLVLLWELSVCNRDGHFSSVSNHSLFSNCNKTEAVITGHHISFSPNPVVLHPDPHNVEVGPTLSVNGSFTITRVVANETRVELLNSVLIESTDGYTELCYILPWDVCHVTDICDLLDRKNISYCPVNVTELEGDARVPWNCKCPLPMGKYQIPHIKWTFGTQPFRLKGHFKVDINIKENALNIGCFSFEFSFKKGEQLSGAFGLN
ncbi:uncharacterized protein LOC128227099 [Mya arenaria]|uniref:uncharacterized protein LOC128227099 n=1 Tax=Mya arenaria TaxID=6604 RepID=UPI0022E2AA99|nr:uncharacterized protein LOC128227099 [Mya arenaria]